MKPSTLFGVISIIGAIFWIPLPSWASLWAMSAGGIMSLITYVLFDIEIPRKKEAGAK